MAITESLWIVNTRTCNLDCSYCYQGSHSWTWQIKKNLVKMMTQETMDTALEWAVDWCQSGLKCIWYGGEPLLNFKIIKQTMPKWKKRFEEAGKDLQWSITTNGTMLHQEQRDMLDEYGVGILLSMDGPPHLHDQSRVYYGGGPSWDQIPVDDILKWRPNLEIAWQLDPRYDFYPKDIEWMIDRGFHNINFNLNWLEEWPAENRIRLEEFFRFVARRCLQTRKETIPKEKYLRCNQMSKFDELMMKTSAGLGKPIQPCGTGMHMLGITPEGWLYPSQEMAFTALEPDRAPGTAEYYRVGDVNESPVINSERLQIVSKVKNSDMIIPEGFDCNNCIANPISFGGCHCRYVGQEGSDPANRYGVAKGWCQTQVSTMTGILQGSTIENYVGLKLGKKPQPKPGPEVKHKPAGRLEFRVGSR